MKLFSIIIILALLIMACSPEIIPSVDSNGETESQTLSTKEKIDKATAYPEYPGPGTQNSGSSASFSSSEAYPSPIVNTPTPSPTSTPIPQPLTVIEWKTYTYNNDGVYLTIQYPANWLVTPNLVRNQVSFSDPDALPFAANYGVLFEVHSLPVENKGITNPYNWMPNEGAYEVLWSAPVFADSIEGIEFVWGPRPQDDSRYDATDLHAIIYHQQQELDIRLETGFDEESLDQIQELGFDMVITSRFKVFTQMVESIRFYP